MRKIFLLLFLLLFPVVSYSQPLILFDTDRYDFGTINVGEMIEYTFEFTNAGDEELVIEKLIPS